MNREFENDANECLLLLKSAFNQSPSSKSGLALEIPELAEILEGGVFPVVRYNLLDFEKDYPFCHISQDWAGYLGAIFAYKIIEALMFEKFRFLNGPIFQNFLYLFETNTISLEAIAETFTRKQRLAFGIALDCILAGVPPCEIEDKHDLERLLQAIERWGAM
jgi:hypothetical protein